MSDTIPENAPQRQCRTCKQWFPLTSEYFYRCKDLRDGFHYHCKPCQRTPIPNTTKPIRTSTLRDQFGRVVSYPQEGRVLDVPSKICSKCHVEKPLDQYEKSRTELYGVRAVCRECRKAENKEYYARRYGLKRDLLPEPVNSGKVCRRCRQEKPFAEYHPDKRASDGCNSQCKKCMAEVQIPNKERNLARTRRKWEENGEKYRKSHKEWRKKNHDRLKELSRRRDARKKKAQTEPVSYKNIRQRDGMWCYICEQPIHPGQRTAFDHVIPLVPRKGATHAPGAHSEDNIKITHYLCNARKGNKLLEELSPHDRRGVKTPHIEQV